MLSEVNKFYLKHHHKSKTIDELSKITKLKENIIKTYIESLPKTDLLHDNGTTSMTSQQSLIDDNKKLENKEFYDSLNKNIFKINPDKPIV